MRHLRRITTTSLFLLFTLLAFTTTAIRADDKTDDEYEENARVARVSLLRGDVQLRRNGSKDWERARVNFPLVEGDVLATTGQDARLEVQIDARNFVRVGGDSILRIVSLRDEGVALSLSEGTMTIRLARFDADKEYFEVDAPGTTLAAEKRGTYRIDVSRDRAVRMTARDGARARIYSETSGFTLREGRSAELVSNGSDAGDWELSKAESFDSWDEWVDERERYLAARLRYNDRDRYYDRDVWGAEELDAYGDWTYAGDYGWVWRPHVTVINNYHNWAPYRYGHWTWCPPYGWTWVGDEPWGWAPYHYGRWVFYNNNWCWAPRGYGYSYGRAWWRPALVAFVYIPTSYGEQVCWYPLRHGQRDPRGRHYRRLQPLRSRDVARLERTNPAYLRAVTGLPARQFGRQGVRAQPATVDLARRAVTTEAVRGRLPIVPTDGAATNASVNDRRVPRAAPVRPPRATNSEGASLLDRPTGAAARTPGVALDNELRRTRLYQGRDPRPSSGTPENRDSNRDSSGLFDRVDAGNTGAVTRPPRSRSTDTRPVERNTQGNEGNRNDGNVVTPPTERPGRRPPRLNPGEERTTSQPSQPSEPSSPSIERPPLPPPPARNDDEPRPRVRPRRDDNDGSEIVPRPSRRDEPRPESRPEPRPEPRPESRPETRPEPRPEPRPESRPEPRPETRPEPRPEPRPESRPEPRQESRPEPKPDPPPRREESKPDPPQRDRSDTARPPRRGENR